MSTSSPVTVAEIKSLLEQTQTLTAWQKATASGNFPDVDDPQSLVLAARLTWQLGGRAQSSALIRKAWNRFPDNPEVIYYRALQLFERRGPYFCWEFVKEQDDKLAAANADVTSSWSALRGQIAAMLRDFDLAETWLRKANETNPQSPWVLVCQAFAYECEDRYDDALETIEQALKLRQNYRPAVQSKGHLLSLKHRDDEAIEYMSGIAMTTELGVIAGQCTNLLMERKRFDEAKPMLARYLELSPLLDKRAHRWLQSHYYEFAYRAGDFDQAIVHARASKSPYMTRIADRLEKPEHRQDKRVELEVPFVRQHHRTCVPATLTAIAQYWSMNVDHVQLADSICYNGTTAYNERHWAETNGWVVREFTVTEEATRQLLDAEVPFTLTTTAPGNAHLQAVIGYDGRCGTILIRDPFIRYTMEAQVDEFLKDQRSLGPRGMALVPAAESHRLESLVLPDSAQWDLLHQVDAALETHRRADAGLALERLKTEYPDHWITIEGRYRLGYYDNNLLEQLLAIEDHLKLHPENERLILARLSLMHDVAKRDERLGILEQVCAKRHAHPILKQMLAHELSQDHRQLREAIDMTRRAIRSMPLDSYGYDLLAQLLWNSDQREKALEIYRFAACLDDKNEQIVSHYFGASQALGQTNQALNYMVSRFNRWGKKSIFPARTLYDALQRLERSTEALELLRKAIKKRPDDGSLKLFAARAFCATNLQHHAQAATWMQEAEGNAPPGEWLRTAAFLASLRGEPAEALQHYRKMLETQPLNAGIHSAIASSLSEIEGREAALEYLAQTTEQYPNFLPLWELRCSWLGDQPAEEREPIVRQALTLNPDNAWARRELGFILFEAKRFDEAWQEHDIAAHLEPKAAPIFRLRALLSRETRTIEEAKEALRDAIRQSVDDDYAIDLLMEMAVTSQQRRKELELVRHELGRQIIYGDGLLAFRRHASRVLEADELLKICREGLRNRPDLWHSWSAYIQQAMQVNDLDAAWKAAVQATKRFPLLPRLWVDRADVARVREDFAAQLEALETAYRINPQWNEIVLSLKDARLHQGDFVGARRLIESAIAQSPQNALLLMTLAELLWGESLRIEDDKREELRKSARERIEQAIALEPGFDDAWDLLMSWSSQLNEPEFPVKVARDLVAKRPTEARSYYLLARVLEGKENLEESLNALDTAIAKSPRFMNAIDLKAKRLAADDRLEEALAVARTNAFGSELPVMLRMTSAEILASAGQIDQAIEQTRVLLRLEPTYTYGWYRLANWYRDREEWTQYREASENLVKLAPHNDMCLGFLGEALINTGDREGAKRAYERASSLNPEYEFASLSLIDMYLEDNEVEKAATLAQRVEPFNFSPYFWGRQAKIAVKRNDRQAAMHALALCCTSDDIPWGLNTAIAEMQKVGWNDEIESVLTEALDNPSTSYDAMIAWGNAAAKKFRDNQSRVLQLATMGDREARAVYGFLEGCRSHVDLRPAIDFVVKNRDALSANTFCWGGVGFFLCVVRHWELAWESTRDWKSRPERQAWMMTNIAEAHFNVGRFEEGFEAVRDGMTFGQRIPCLLILSAWDEYFQDNPEAARELVGEVDYEGLDVEYQVMYRLLKLLFAADDKSNPSNRETLKGSNLVKELKAIPALIPYWNEEHGRRSMYRLAVQTLKKKGLGFFTNLRLSFVSA